MNAAKILFLSKKIQTKKAAEDLNIEITRLAKILNGSARPTIDEAESIKRYLDFNIQPIYLFADIPIHEIEKFLYQYFSKHQIT